MSQTQTHGSTEPGPYTTGPFKPAKTNTSEGGSESGSIPWDCHMPPHGPLKNHHPNWIGKLQRRLGCSCTSLSSSCKRVGGCSPSALGNAQCGNAAIRSAECYRGGGGHTNGGRGSSGSDFLTNDCGECYKINPFCQVFIEINHFHRLEKTVTYWTERETSNACFNASSINQDRSNPFNIWGPL